MQTIGPEYDHIDFYDGEQTVRHYLKDQTARNDIDDINSRMPRNIKDGSGEGAVVENHLTASSEVDVPNQASGVFAHAEGQSTEAAGQAAHAEGSSTSATSIASHAEGNGTTASGLSTHAEGRSTIAGADSAHAEGFMTRANGRCSHAEGHGSAAVGEGAHAEGAYTTASGAHSHAAGFQTVAARRSQVVFGENNIPETGLPGDKGLYIEIVGNGSEDGHPSNARTLDWAGNEQLSGHLTVDKGTENESEITGQRWREIPMDIRDGTGLHSIISNLVDAEHDTAAINVASGEYSSAEGYNTRSSGDYSHAEGSNTAATGDGAHSEGVGTTASGNYSHAGGDGTAATAASSCAFGVGTEANGQDSFVCGFHTASDHLSQFVFGAYNSPDPSEMSATYRGTYIEMVGNGQSLALRSNARTLDWSGNERLAGSLTIGAGSADEATLAPDELNTLKLDVSSIKSIINNVPKNSRDGIGRGSVVIASDSPSRASGENSVAESSGNASGRNSHAEGNGSLAQGLYSHAEGYNTTAGGTGTHAQGYSAVANGEYSHAEGCGTIASGQYQHAAGRWNLPDTTSAEIIGNGVANNRSNARTLDWNGNETLAGSLTVAGDVVAGGVSLKETAANMLPAADILNDYSLVKLSAVKTSYITTKRYVPGEYISAGQYLFRATQTIAQYSFITPGVNCERVYLEDLFNDIYSKIN